MKAGALYKASDKESDVTLKQHPFARCMCFKTSLRNVHISIIKCKIKLGAEHDIRFFLKAESGKRGV